MKQYNLSPAYKKLVISKSSRSYLSKDEAVCAEKKLTALDFALWYDERLIDSGVSLSLPAFRYILKCIDDGFILHSAIGNYRLACLLLAKFMNCDASHIKSIEKDFLADHPDFELSKPKEETKKLDYAAVYDYDHTAANKKIFPYIASKGIDKGLAAELISRGLLAFDDRYALKNLVFVCDDLIDYHGFEIRGMTEDKPFLQLTGEPFPFIYFREEAERIDYEDFTRAEIFDDTLKMLRYLSELRESADGIPYRVLFVSLHKSDYSKAAYSNYRRIFGNLYESWHCGKGETDGGETDGGETATAPATAEAEPPAPTAAPAEPEEAPFKFYSRDELLQMRDSGGLSTDIFEKYKPSEESAEYTFEEIIELPQAKLWGKIFFKLPNDDCIDIFGNVAPLPF